MQLPFSIVVDPPTRAELAHLRRFWWVAAIVVGLVLGVCGALALAAPRLWVQPRVLTILDLRSEPSGAVVEVDDRRQAYTPAHLILPPGAHHVTLRRPGYGDASYDVTLDARHPASLAATLWPQSPAASGLRPPFPGGSIVGADFVRDGRVALTITLGGGRERQIWLVDSQEAYQRVGPSSGALGLAVSADAARIAYLAPPQGLTADSTQPPVVWIADAAGDDPHRLDLSPSSDVNLDDLSWAPDGRHLLVVGHVPRSGGGQSSVLLWADASGGAARELARIPSEVVPGSDRWSPVNLRP